MIEFTLATKAMTNLMCTGTDLLENHFFKNKEIAYYDKCFKRMLEIGLGETMCSILYKYLYLGAKKDAVYSCCHKKYYARIVSDNFIIACTNNKIYGIIVKGDLDKENLNNSIKEWNKHTIIYNINAFFKNKDRELLPGQNSRTLVYTIKDTNPDRKTSLLNSLKAIEQMNEFNFPEKDMWISEIHKIIQKEGFNVE